MQFKRDVADNGEESEKIAEDADELTDPKAAKTADAQHLAERELFRCGCHPDILVKMKSSMKLAMFVCFVALGLAGAEPLSLWYTQPAKLWTDALPVGNG